MQYSEFLFCQLFYCVLGEPANIEYDLAFPIIQIEYSKYNKSSFNNDEKNEYDCIIDYLNNNKDNIIKMLNTDLKK